MRATASLGAARLMAAAQPATQVNGCPCRKALRHAMRAAAGCPVPLLAQRCGLSPPSFREQPRYVACHAARPSRLIARPPLEIVSACISTPVVSAAVLPAVTQNIVDQSVLRIARLAVGVEQAAAETAAAV